MRIVIAGSSGFIGSRLVADLAADGHDVVRLVRREPSASGEVSWAPERGVLSPEALAGSDAVVNLAGVGVGDKRWTEAYKRLIRSSRVDTTATLARTIATVSAAGEGPAVLVNASAIGYYGDRGDEELDECSAPGTGFFTDVCRDWEAATMPAEEAGVRVCRIRSGLVVGPRGGLMGRLIPLFKAGLGGRLGNGRQYMPWVSLADEIGAIRFLLDHPEVHGPVNVTGPAPVTNAEFTRALAAAVHRPALFTVPGFALRTVLGEFALDVTTSSRVLPKTLVAAGYRHRHADVNSSLRWAISHR